MRKTCNKKGFTIIELLIVIVIIGILVGVAVPYYNDYIYDSRLSVLKQNLAVLRKVINDFRGDRGRGPFRIEVQSGAAIVHYPRSSNSTTGSELVAGAFLPNGTRQSNIKYLEALPNMIDPADGSNRISTIDFSVSQHTVAYFESVAPANVFNIDAEFAFFDENRDGIYDAGETELYNLGAAPAAGTPGAVALDYIDFEITGSDGTKY